MPSGFHQLRVYRLAVDLSDEIYASVARWPSYPRNAFGLQLVRAVDSVAANIAEATGATTHPTSADFWLSLAARSMRLSTG